MNRKRISLAVAALSAGIAQSASAGFTVTATRVVIPGFDRYDVRAFNDTIDTGTQVKGLEYFYNGSPAAFEVQDTGDEKPDSYDGIPDTVYLLSACPGDSAQCLAGAYPIDGATLPSFDYLFEQSGQRMQPRITVTDYGDAEKVLTNRRYLDEATRRRSQAGTTHPATIYGGWLGRHESAIAAHMHQAPPPKSKTPQPGRARG